jgi:hypothetical protein
MSAADTGYSTPPYDDDLDDTEVLPVRRRRRLPLLTGALLAALVAAVAFVGGVLVQKHYGAASSGGSTPAASGASSLASSRAGRAGRTFPGAAAGGGGTVGLVTLIRGSTLYVTDFSGNTVKVKLSAASRVTKTSTVSAKSIHPGDTVVVRGTQGKNGVTTADSVSIGGAGGAGLFGGAPTGRSGGGGTAFAPKG